MGYQFLRTFLLLLFISPIACASSSIQISKWRETTDLTSYGKKSEILIQGKIKNLPKDRALTSFSIGFDKARNIKINKVTSDSRTIKNFSFKANVLDVTFNKPKPNNSSIRIYFTYDEKYRKIKKFLRAELIDIPPFASGAEAVVTLKFPGSLESATLNPNVTKTANSFVYRNIVPQNGVREVIKLTSSQNTWDINVKNSINSDSSLGEVIVDVPKYFKNVGQVIRSTKTLTSIIPSKRGVDGNKNALKFNTPISNLLIESKAQISTGKTSRTRIFRVPAQYLKVTEAERKMLTPILNQIKSNPKYRQYPLYAKIGMFVNQYIKYDLNHVGKLYKVAEILRDRIGVCTEYATLFNALARVAGIPSFIVDGAACGEYEKCEGHTWNMIYYNNRWFPIDATWDLMSGIVSSSHVYFNDRGKGNTRVRYINDGKKINTKVDFEMKLLN